MVELNIKSKYLLDDEELESAIDRESQREEERLNEEMDINRQIANNPDFIIDIMD